jgi:hypothetical protein
MSLQLNHAIDLNDSGVLAWLGSGATKAFKEAPPDVALREQGLERVEGSERQIGASEVHAAQQYTATIRHYELIKVAATTGKERKLRDITVQVPVLHELTIGIESLLYIAYSKVSKVGEKLIQDTYAAFNGEDPFIFVAELLNSNEAKAEGLTSDHFHVAMRYTLLQNGAPKPNYDQDTALKNLYAGGAIVQGDREWFRKERIVLKFIRDEPGKQLLSPQIDPLRQQDSKGRSDSEILDEVSKEIAGNLNCDDEYKHEDRPIMTILAWPEFKVVWYAQDIKIGCVRIRVWLPKLETRIAEIVLYATVAVARRDADTTLLKMLGDCASGSAVVGSVVGVVMMNFAGGLAAFKALFESCIYIKIGQHLTCLVPELVLITKKGTWK